MLNQFDQEELEWRYSAFMRTERQVRLMRCSEHWVATRKTTPAMQAPEQALLESLDDRQLKLYVALKAVQPVVVDQ
jgi:hypothetical protein